MSCISAISGLPSHIILKWAIPVETLGGVGINGIWNLGMSGIRTHTLQFHSCLLASGLNRSATPPLNRGENHHGLPFSRCSISRLKMSSASSTCNPCRSIVFGPNSAFLCKNRYFMRLYRHFYYVHCHIHFLSKSLNSIRIISWFYTV